MRAGGPFSQFDDSRSRPRASFAFFLRHRMVPSSEIDILASIYCTASTNLAMGNGQWENLARSGQGIVCRPE